MKKLVVTLSTAALFAVSATASADDASGTPPASQPAAGAPVQTTVPASSTATSTTTVTSAGSLDGAPVIAPPPSSSAAQSQDTTTLYQKNRPNKALLYTGGLLFLGAYVPTAVVTAANPDSTSPSNDRSLYLPVVGPWMHLADRNCDGCSNNTRDTMLIAASGVVQGAGIGLMVASLLVPEKVPAATIQAGTVKMNVGGAAFGPASAGLGATGTF